MTASVAALPILDPWPSRPDLRDRLIAAGVERLDADLMALLTQTRNRPDLEVIVRKALR